jgi:prevent-host-death family protein
MTIRNVSEAKAQLSSLLTLVESGEEVIIARSGKPIAKIVAIKKTSVKPKYGLARGKIWISPDFDAPDPELEALFNGDEQ